MGRKIVASLFGMFLMTLPAFAADNPSDAKSDSAPIVTASLTTLPVVTPSIAAAVATAVTPVALETAATTTAPAAAQTNWSPPRRPVFLPVLYVGLAALQAYDTYSTLSAYRTACTGGTRICDTNSIDTCNPTFVNSTAGDFHLTSGDTCARNAGIDAASALGCIAGSTCFDYDADMRPQP